MVEAASQQSMANILWPVLPEFGAAHREFPAPGGVHLYMLPLQPTGQNFEQYLAFLSSDDFEVHRRRFVLGRGQLRLILGSYFQIAPARICFSYGAYGKPCLAEPALTEIQFNLAHSDQLAVLAVTVGRPVGVDIEQVRELDDFDELVGRFFSRNEAAAFSRLAACVKPAAFFNLWTRKEAVLKATGQGIGHLLSQVEVSFLPGEETKVLQLPSQLGQLEDWALHSLKMPNGFSAALAVQERINLHQL
jgi:4'-phosphopantetheinyl transferase